MSDAFVIVAGVSTRVAGVDLGDGTAGLATAPAPPTASSVNTPSVFGNFGADATKNVKTSAGNVFALYCANTNAAVRYLQIHATATTPAPGAVPFLCFLLPATGSIVIGADYFTAAGVHVATGIAFAFSTTMATYTAGTAGEQLTGVVYK